MVNISQWVTLCKAKYRLLCQIVWPGILTLTWILNPSTVVQITLLLLNCMYNYHHQLACLDMARRRRSQGGVKTNPAWLHPWISIIHGCCYFTTLPTQTSSQPNTALLDVFMIAAQDFLGLPGCHGNTDALSWCSTSTLTAWDIYLHSVIVLYPPGKVG